MKTINEDVVARYVMTDSFAAIRVLTITIQSAYEIVRTTRGSPESIEIAKKRIPEALDNINSCIKRAQELTDDGMKQFNAHTKTILDIAGPEIAEKVMNLAQYEDEINKALEIENTFIFDLYKAEGEAIRYENLMAVIDNKRQAVRREIADIENKKKELLNRNMDIDNIKQSVPQKVTEKRMVKSSSSSFWGLFRESSEKLVDVEIENPNKISDQNYYESIITARTSRIAQMDGTENSKNVVLKDLDELYDKYEKCHRDAKALAKSKDEMKEKIKSKTKEAIDHNRQKIKETREEAGRLETKFGYNGQSLVDCLTTVKSFGKSLKDGTTAYSPIYTILKEIRAMVLQQVDLLTCSNQQASFIAGKMLMKNVQFLSKYNIMAIEAVKKSEGYNKVSKAIDTKIELLAIK